MKRVLWVVAAVCVLAAAAYIIVGPGRGRSQALLCYTGGTMRPAVEELARRWQERTGAPVQVEYADSGELLIRIEKAPSGDVLIVHDPFGGGAEKKGLAASTRVAASLTPVIVVPKGNPKGIGGLRDLARPGLKLILTDAEYSTAGHVVALMLARAGVEKAVEANVVSRTRQGGEAANAVTLGTADAAIVWNAAAHLRADKLDAIAIEPELLPRPGVDAVTSATYGKIDMGRVAVTVSCLKCSLHPREAEAFAEYLASPEAEEVWSSFGFSPAGGAAAVHLIARASALPAAPAAWTPPENLAGSILVLAGAGVEPALTALSPEFTRACGVAVDTSYGGSNVLLGQLELSRKGDVFIPGDAEYVEMARSKGLVTASREIFFFVPVVMVAAGNPKGVRSVADLARPGLKVGLGDPKACAVGRVTPRIFELNGVDPGKVRENVKLTTATVSELAMNVKLGTLDAAIVWSTTAAQHGLAADAVAIEPGKNVIPSVEAAVAAGAANPKAAAAFVDFLASQRAREVLKAKFFVVERPR
jgi:molybdate transport system substrate-binding protein